MRASALWGLLLIAPLLTGCIGASDETIEGTDAPSTTGVGLADPLEALEAGDPSANIELLSEWRQGGAQEADVWGDLLAVDRGSTVHLLDVSDPASVEEVTSWQAPVGVLDVKFSDDGQYLFIGDDAEAGNEVVGGQGPLTGGFYAVDIRDRDAPELVAFLPVGPQRGPHMVATVQTQDGRELLFGAAGPDVVIASFDREAGTLEELARYTPGPLAQDRDPNRLGPLYNPLGWVHDMFVMEESDGQLLMYVAAWDAGLRVVDVTDPTSPQEVGAWADFADDEEGNLHTVSTAWVGDRRITVGSVEVGFGVVGGTHYAQGKDKPVLYVWDTTDETAPEPLAHWVNPLKPYAGRDLVQGETIDSTHNLQLEQGRVYLAHYGLGAWVLDVSTPETQEAPEVIGYYNETEMNTWDVVLLDGVLYTSGRAGVLGLHFLADPLGPDGVTSRA